LLVIFIVFILLSQCFINVYVVLFLFNNVIYVFLLYDCMFMYDYYPDRDFSRAFSSVVRQISGWYAQTWHGPHSSHFYCCSMYFLCCFMYFCVILCIVCFVIFPVLSLCICVLNNCHRVATQLQLNIIYDSCKFVVQCVCSVLICDTYS
jgi:hypothetical protein